MTKAFTAGASNPRDLPPPPEPEPVVTEEVLEMNRAYRSAKLISGSEVELPDDEASIATEQLLVSPIGTNKTIWVDTADFGSGGPILAPVPYIDSTDGSANYTVLAGAIPGDTFTVSAGSFIAGSLTLKWNGKGMSGTEFSAVPATGVITINYEIPSGTLMAEYRAVAI